LFRSGHSATGSSASPWLANSPPLVCAFQARHGFSRITEYVNVAALAPIPGIRMPVESEVDLWIARMAFYRKKAQ
jgi:hypothetical protein